MLPDIMKVTLKTLASMILAAITLMLSIAIVYLAVSRNAKNKTYSFVKEIPYNRVGLVLGTSPYTSTGHSNYFFTTRINAASELYKAGKVRKLIVSGDNHMKEYDEPSYMRDALIRKGVPSSAIVLDYAGFRTLDSVVRAKEVFGQEKITIISQRFHNERAIYLAEAYGIEAIGYNAKDAKRTKRSLMITVVRESMSRVKMFIDILTGKDPKFLGEKIVV